MNPQISILINNYNYDKFVEKAVTSALAQTYPNVQVIVVDDGSTDKSREIIDRYADKALVIKKPNGGQGSAFNTGFEKVTGDIVIILDSDDCLYPDACTEIVAAWNADTSMCCYMLDVCDQDGNLTGQVLPDIPLLPSAQREHVLKYGYIPVAPMSGVAYSRRYLEWFYPLDEKVWFCAFDGLFAYVAPLMGAVVSITKPLGLYRLGHASLSEHASLSIRKVRGMLTVSNLYAAEIETAAHKVLHVQINQDRILGPYYWRNRLLSFIAGDTRHPYAGDTQVSLLLKGIRPFLLWPDLSAAKRAKGIAAMCLMTILPAPWVAPRIAAKLGVDLSVN